MYDINIHLGGPRCMSTSIQATLSEKTDILYLGFRPNKNMVDWYPNKIIQKLLDLDLKYSSRSHFNKSLDFYVSYIESLVGSDGRKEVWLSSENLISRFTLEEINVVEKLSRLIEVFKNFNFCFHILFRTYESALVSSYGEYVSRKYDKSFIDFLDELYFLSPMGIIDHILPNKSIENLLLAFGDNKNFHLNLHFPDFDNERNNFPNVNNIEKRWGFQINKKILNRSPDNIPSLSRLNKEFYHEKNIHNFMEFHRYHSATDFISDANVLDERNIRYSLLKESSKFQSSCEWQKVVKETNLYKQYVVREHALLDQIFQDNSSVLSMSGSPEALLKSRY